MRYSLFSAASLFVPSIALAQPGLYAVDFPGNLYQVNATTGAATLVGFTGFDRLNAAAADPTGMIYSARFRVTTNSADTNKLIKIDPTTGLGTLVADYGTEEDLRALAFGPGGVLFGIREGIPDVLVTIDPVNGAVTTVGPTGRNDIQGLTMGPGEQLYALGVTGTGGTLMTIDATTGAATVLMSALNAGSDIQTIEWVSGDQALVARAGLRSVNLTTGASTLIGATGVTDIRGLAMVTPGGGCYANCDQSTTAPVLNVADFSCFLSKFAAGAPYANCDQSTTPPVLNVADFSCFLSKFAAGCP